MCPMFVAGEGGELFEFGERLPLEEVVDSDEQMEREEQEDGDSFPEEEQSSDDDDDNSHFDFLDFDGCFEVILFLGMWTGRPVGGECIVSGVGGALTHGELSSGMSKQAGDSKGELESE